MRYRLLIPLLVAWPLAHTVLTSVTSISSWKLAGWGMYATPHFSRRGALVLQLHDLRETLPPLGPAVGVDRVLAVRGDAIEPVNDVPQAAPSFRDFRLWGTAGKASELLRIVGDPTGPSLVLLTTPRFTPVTGRTDVDVVAYLGDLEGDAALLGRWSTLEVSESQLRREIATAARRILSGRRGPRTTAESGSPDDG